MIRAARARLDRAAVVDVAKRPVSFSRYSRTDAPPAQRQAIQPAKANQPRHDRPDRRGGETDRAGRRLPRSETPVCAETRERAERRARPARTQTQPRRRGPTMAVPAAKEGSPGPKRLRRRSVGRHRPTRFELFDRRRRDQRHQGNAPRQGRPDPRDPERQSTPRLEADTRAHPSLTGQGHGQGRGEPQRPPSPNARNAGDTASSASTRPNRIPRPQNRRPATIQPKTLPTTSENTETTSAKITLLRATSRQSRQRARAPAERNGARFASHRLAPDPAKPPAAAQRRGADQDDAQNEPRRVRAASVRPAFDFEPSIETMP